MFFWAPSWKAPFYFFCGEENIKVDQELSLCAALLIVRAKQKVLAIFRESLQKMKTLEEREVLLESAKRKRLKSGANSLIRRWRKWVKSDRPT